jgi:hypothetical protein
MIVPVCALVTADELHRAIAATSASTRGSNNAASSRD